MTESRRPAATTHDWSRSVDTDHLALIRSAPETYGAGGLQHLILEVLAYAAEEAQALQRTGHCEVRFHPDGSVSVTDDGRGTAIHRDDDGRIVRKPVMATRDLRFFDTDEQVLPDGRPRRGMSTVAALSVWLEHTNHRLEGAWSQRYEYGVPASDLVERAAGERTGTTVHFLPRTDVPAGPQPDPLVLGAFDSLTVNLRE